MTKLEKFLLAKSSEMIKAETTFSRYFIIENVSIRLSDHISNTTTSDIQIIIPTNEIAAGLYTVIFGNSNKVLIWNCKQIQEFLPSMILMKEMNTKSMKPVEPSKSVIQKIELAQNPEPVKESQLEFKGWHTTKLKIASLSADQRRIFGKTNTTWCVNDIGVLSSLLHKEFKQGNLVNEDFQIFLNCTPANYSEVINLYKTVVIDNNKVPTIELLQEAWSLIH